MPEARFHSVFDIIGPVMIGPSSSHTAGASKIGHVVRKIFGEEPEKIDVYLYASFAKTYRGHGTDLAIIGGLLGMGPDDSNLADSLAIARKKGIKVTFIPKSTQVHHPNTARIVLTKGNHKLDVVGESIGGGNIRISEIDGFSISLSVGVPTYIEIHRDVPGMVARATKVFSANRVNIAKMTVTRESRGKKAIMIIETDTRQPGILKQLRSLENVESVTFFE